MNQLKLYITEYIDGTARIEAKHLHYAFNDNFNADDVKPDELTEKMRNIAKNCKRENLEAIFIIN